MFYGTHVEQKQLSSRPVSSHRISNWRSSRLATAIAAFVSDITSLFFSPESSLELSLSSIDIEPDELDGLFDELLELSDELGNQAGGHEDIAGRWD
jgi:hypothetical protein